MLISTSDVFYSASSSAGGNIYSKCNAILQVPLLVLISTTKYFLYYLHSLVGAIIYCKCIVIIQVQFAGANIVCECILILQVPLLVLIHVAIYSLLFKSRAGAISCKSILILIVLLAYAFLFSKYL